MATTVQISRLIAPERVVLELAASKRTQAIHETAQLLASHPKVANFQGFYSDLLQRDRLDTTCVGNGVALPHARTEHVSGLVLAIGRSRAGVLFENSGQKVNLICVLGTPRTMAADYLLAVSALCRLLKQGTTREQLLQAASAAEFVEILRLAEQPETAPAAR